MNTVKQFVKNFKQILFLKLEWPALIATALAALLSGVFKSSSGHVSVANVTSLNLKISINNDGSPEYCQNGKQFTNILKTI